ncbi:hypothetical protein [Mycobacterium marinum]|uniref:hypothetical protein n=1 Tax=Mycobacterium marinum TaxID=1781 RepID=UPI002358707E|nr:hypothetical protein [Mycobacterium marinum]MDC9004097.1 hypothetical protein [Mycobacterium marinum]
MNDSFDEVQQKLTALEEKYAEDLTRSETQLVELAQSALRQWCEGWRDPEAVSKLAVEARLHRKFLMCFPLAAHAMNQIEAALTVRHTFPWVAAASTRIAFEHALTAQWVLLTADGEIRLKAGFDYGDHIRADRFIKGIRQLGEEDQEFPEAAHGLSADQLERLVRTRPDEPGPPNVEGICKRFSSGGAENLLYDIHRELSGAVHPSLSLLRAHLHFTSTGQVSGIDSFGACDAPVMFGRELALSAVWALYAVEVCRFGQARMGQIAAMGTDAGLPVDLRKQRPAARQTTQGSISLLASTA